MRRELFVLVLCGIVWTPVFAFATSNLGSDQPSPPCANVLTGPSPLGVSRILYAPSEPDDPSYRAAIAGMAGAVVDYFDARNGTPSPSLLASYDCVYTWVDYSYADRNLFGNELADYVDAGGKVILGVFCTYTGFSLGGRIMTASYCPVTSPTGGNHFTLSYYAGDGTTCIHKSVLNYDCVYRDVLVTQGAGAVDGHYADAEIAQAYRPDKRVIYSNGCGAAGLGATGDWPRLIANSCSCDNSVPTENQTWGGLKARYR